MENESQNTNLSDEKQLQIARDKKIGYTLSENEVSALISSCANVDNRVSEPVVVVNEGRAVGSTPGSTNTNNMCARPKRLSKVPQKFSDYVCKLK